MTRDKHTDIGARLKDTDGILDAMQQAAQEARRRHIQNGIRAATVRDGRVVLVNPVDLTEIKAQRDSA